MNFPRRNSPQFRIPLVTTTFDSSRFATALDGYLWKCYDGVFISFQTDFLNRHGLILDLDKLGNKYRNKYFTAKKYSPQRNVGGEWSN